MRGGTGRRWHAQTIRVAVLGLVAALALAIRVGRRSGATSAEARAPLAGDGLVPSPMWSSTRAITIDAPPRAIWPWLVQMGFPAHRAGWYTPHWLDRLMWGIHERSADRVRPELQGLTVGDRVPDSRDRSVYFSVAELFPERALVLHSTRHLLKPVRGVDFSWAFVLTPAGAGRTRLLIRARARYEPRWAGVLLEPLIGLGDALNATVMLRGIRARAEGRSAGHPHTRRAPTTRAADPDGLESPGAS
jgi:hypothetical protein